VQELEAQLLAAASGMTKELQGVTSASPAAGRAVQKLLHADAALRTRRVPPVRMPIVCSTQIVPPALGTIWR
jgi:hypothetical protein